MIEFKEEFDNLWIVQKDGNNAGLIKKSGNGRSKPYRLFTWETGKGVSRRFKTLEAAQRRAEELLTAGSFNNKQGE